MIVETAPPALLAGRAAVWVADRLWSAHAARGEAHLAVSGGTTPAAMFAALASLPLPWRALHIWQVDERVAPDGDPRRNARQLEPLAATGAAVHVMGVTATHLAGAAMGYGSALPHRLDVVHLGLGDDGHTASWPPGDPVIDTASPCAVVGPFNGTMRMTLTPTAVNGARSRMFLVSGEAKRAILMRLITHDSGLPASRVQAGDTTVLTDLTLATA